MVGTAEKDQSALSEVHFRYRKTQAELEAYAQRQKPEVVSQSTRLILSHLFWRHGDLRSLNSICVLDSYCQESVTLGILSVLGFRKSSYTSLIIGENQHGFYKKNPNEFIAEETGRKAFDLWNSKSYKTQIEADIIRYCQLMSDRGQTREKVVAAIFGHFIPTHDVRKFLQELEKEEERRKSEVALDPPLLETAGVEEADHFLRRYTFFEEEARDYLPERIKFDDNGQRNKKNVEKTVSVRITAEIKPESLIRPMIEHAKKKGLISESTFEELVLLASRVPKK